MSTLSQLITYITLCVILNSCNFNGNYFNTGLVGNGHVVIEQRDNTLPFETIKVSTGLNLILTQDSETFIEVEADENLQEHIKTEIKDGVLKIYTDNSIRRANSKKVLVSFVHINKITASSGSEVYSTNTIKVPALELTTSSGSDISVAVDTEKLICSSSSGSDLEVEGNTLRIMASSSSGSDLDASKLVAGSCIANASSGSDILVNCSEELIANASSGGDIRYKGQPETIERNRSSGGDVHQL